MKPPTLGALQQQAVPWRGQAGVGEARWEQADGRSRMGEGVGWDHGIIDHGIIVAWL